MGECLCDTDYACKEHIAMLTDDQRSELATLARQGLAELDWDDN